MFGGMFDALKERVTRIAEPPPPVEVESQPPRGSLFVPKLYTDGAPSTAVLDEQAALLDSPTSAQRQEAAGIIVSAIKIRHQRMAEVRKLQNDAGGTMQRAVRGWLARSRLNKRRRAALQLTSGARGYAARKERRKLRGLALRAQAAIRMQAGSRGWLVRKRRIERARAAAEAEASLSLQAAARGRLGRQRSTMRREELRYGAVRAMVRGVLAAAVDLYPTAEEVVRAEEEARRRHEEQNDASTAVQAAVRRRSARAEAAARRRAKEEEGASRAVQAAVRGRSARSEVAARRRAREEEQATLSLQAAARGRSARGEARRRAEGEARRRLEEAEYQAAAKLQAQWRGRFPRLLAKVRPSPCAPPPSVDPRAWIATARESPSSLLTSQPHPSSPPLCALTPPPPPSAPVSSLPFSRSLSHSLSLSLSCCDVHRSCACSHCRTAQRCSSSARRAAGLAAARLRSWRGRRPRMPRRE